MNTKISPRIGIVCLPNQIEDEGQEFRYHQLLLFLQQQACMAGIPNELLDIDRFLQPASIAPDQNWVFLVPLFHSTESKKLDSQLTHLLNLVKSRCSGLIVLGLPVRTSNKEPLLNPLLDFLGLHAGAPITLSNADFIQGEQARLILGSDYQWGHCNFPEIYFQPINMSNNQHMEVAILVGKNRAEPAIIGGTFPVRFVTLVDHQLLDHKNWLWRAIRWVVYGPASPVGLQLSRSACAFTTRVDMDLSKFSHKVDTVSRPLVELFQTWKQKYGFVSSVYINVGSNKKDGEYTDWNISAPLYRELANMGNEIGSHSYTHPFHVSELNQEQIRFEFEDARKVIERNLEFPAHGCAIPGNPEKIRTAQQIGKYYKYVTGRFSGYGDGYLGAIGYLTPDSEFLYFCPNIWPDYTGIRFFHWSWEKTQQEWKYQVNALLANANVPVIQPLWHDYAMTEELGDGFDIRLYESLLNLAVDIKAEFTTLDRMANRICTLNSANLQVKKTQYGIEVTIISTGDSLGFMCISLLGDSLISSIDNWQAYNDHQVFLPRGGGKFSIHFDSERCNNLRIVSLPPGAELSHVKGEKGYIEITIKGEGLIEIGGTDGRPITSDSEFVELVPTTSNATTNSMLRLSCDRTHSFKVAFVEE